ncbi:DUF1652 domain-containing protein [Pseudomonas sp. Pseusp122]|uniref:DUF1652 domain-containing protein n=1 Tax=unclassified Pseudomonas TaxID=196821 RepID=UPI0039A685C0
MISSLELRHIIEAAFLPTKCACTISSDGSMTIQLTSPENAEEQLTVTGIDSASLASSRSIAALVAELKEELRLGRLTIQERVQA